MLSILVLPVLIFFAQAASAADLTKASPMDSLNTAAKKSTLAPEPTRVDSIPVTIGKIIGTALSFVGVLFLVLIIYAGLLWMTAQGNDTKIATARGIITNAVIGLIIVMSAYAITAFVGSTVGA